MKRLILPIIIFGFSLAEARGLSPLRQVGESFIDARIRASAKSIETLYSFSQSATPLAFAGPLEDLKTDQIPEVSAARDLEREFKYVRDTRFIQSQRPNFPRRITWLFPDDGCYARAEVAAIKLAEHPFLAPKKIFAFGDLSVQTPNSPSGSVTWWYHVAVAYRSGPSVFVFDPALEPRHPLTLEEWNQRLGGTQAQITYAICAARTFDPDADCEQPTVTSDPDVEEEQKGYFKVEWVRVQKLNRDPEKELGDKPPWL